MHKLYVTSEFKRDYKILTGNEQLAIKRALERMKTDLRYPGLHVKKMQGRDEVWEARANRDLRITFIFQKPEALILRSCGHHDQALQ